MSATRTNRPISARARRGRRIKSGSFKGKHIPSRAKVRPVRKTLQERSRRRDA